MDSTLGISYQTIAAFFEAAEGNHRNAVFVTCRCAGREEAGCRDFLFIPGHDCSPLIFPRSDAEVFLGSSIDPTDCAGQMDSYTFLKLYSKWIGLTLTSSDQCPIQQLLCLANGT